MTADTSRVEELFDQYFDEHSDSELLDDEWIVRVAAGNNQLAIALRVAIQNGIDGAKALGALVTPDITSLHTTLRQFDGYELIEPIGGGGFGHVYKARPPGLDRIEAVKFFGTGFPSESFRKEKWVLEKLGEAERIPDVHRAGEIQGLFYIAMDFVEGPTLRQWMDERPSANEKDCVLILDGLLEALVQARTKLQEHAQAEGAHPFSIDDANTGPYDAARLIAQRYDDTAANGKQRFHYVAASARRLMLPDCATALVARLSEDRSSNSTRLGASDFRQATGMSRPTYYRIKRRMPGLSLPWKVRDSLEAPLPPSSDVSFSVKHCGIASYVRGLLCGIVHRRACFTPNRSFSVQYSFSAIAEY